jgi:hypothetical protein
MEEKTTDTLFTEKVKPVTNASTQTIMIVLAIVVGIPLIAVVAAILFFIPANTVVSERSQQVINTPTVSETEIVAVTPTITEPVLTGELYDDQNVFFSIPKRWNKVLAEDGETLIKLEKNGYYFYAASATVTGGGFGYPYDGMCNFHGAHKSTVTYKIGTRYDEYYDLAKDKPLDTQYYAEPPLFKTEAGLCNITPEIQKGQVVWLGSRFGISNETGTSAVAYFDVESDASVVLLVQYSHKNIEESDAAEGKTYAFPVFDSAELKAMIVEMDAIAKTVVYKKR